jgi:hypothetical protein
VEAATVIAVMGHQFRIGLPFHDLLSLFLFEEDEVIELGGAVAVTIWGKPNGDFGGNGETLDDAAVRVMSNSNDHIESSFVWGYSECSGCPGL